MAAAKTPPPAAAATDWRHELLGRLRSLIEDADPEIVEEAKWIKKTNPSGVPAWSHDGLVCTGEVYKDKVKITFFEGASLDDPQQLFNSSLDGGTRRAIDFAEGSPVDEAAFRALVRQAVDRNIQRAASKGRK